MGNGLGAGLLLEKLPVTVGGMLMSWKYKQEWYLGWALPVSLAVSL